MAKCKYWKNCNELGYVYAPKVKACKGKDKNCNIIPKKKAKRYIDIPIVKASMLSIPEMTDILELIERRLEDGSYYGNKNQYIKRLNKIKDKIPGLTKRTK